MRFNISGTRANVQQIALSPAFDAVLARLHSAMSATDDAEHRLQTAITSSLQHIHRRLGAAVHSLSPAQLRANVRSARTRFESLGKAHDAAIATRLETAKQKLSLAAAALDAMATLRVLKRGDAIDEDPAAP